MKPQKVTFANNSMTTGNRFFFNSKFYRTFDDYDLMILRDYCDEMGYDFSVIGNEKVHAVKVTNPKNGLFGFISVNDSFVYGFVRNGQFMPKYPLTQITDSIRRTVRKYGEKTYRFLYGIIDLETECVEEAIKENIHEFLFYSLVNLNLTHVSITRE